MSYLGDIRLGETLDVKFCTVNASGAPTQLAGTPAVSAYPGNSTTQLTAGITLTVDFDGVTGLNHCRVVATSGNGYAAATDYILVLTAGTVGGVSVVGYVIGHVSIENRSALMPTTAARTLDVSAGGEAGLDWANIGSPTTAQGLSGTTVKTATDVEADTQDIQSRLPAALVSGRIDSHVGSVADAVLTAAKFAAGAFDAVWSVAVRVLTAGTNIVLAKGTGVTGFNDLDAAGVRSAVGLASANLDTQLGVIDGNVDDIEALTVATLDAAVSSRATPAQVNAEVVDALNVDTYGEPTGVPPATSTLVQKLGRLYMALRNGVVVDSNTSKKQFLDDGNAAEWEKDFTDSGGVYTESKGNAP